MGNIPFFGGIPCELVGFAPDIFDFCTRKFFIGVEHPAIADGMRILGTDDPDGQ